MSDFIVDWNGNRYRIHIDQHELVITRSDRDGPTPMGRLTLEAAEVLAHLRID